MRFEFLNSRILSSIFSIRREGTSCKSRSLMTFSKYSLNFSAVSSFFIKFFSPYTSIIFELPFTCSFEKETLHVFQNGWEISQFETFSKNCKLYWPFSFTTILHWFLKFLTLVGFNLSLIFS